MATSLAVPGGVVEATEESNEKTLDKLKNQIRDLKSEEDRKEDYKRRLERKLQKLDSALAESVEEVESQQRQLSLERNKRDEEFQSNKRETDAKAQNQEKRILDHLVEVLYTKPSNKPGATGHFDLDTVQISTQTGVGKKNFRYNLAFRIEMTTTVERLKGIVCKYWSKDPNKYVLKTMGNSKCADEICVYQCFKQGEIAQLRLEEKLFQESEPKEAELKAIQPKKGKSEMKSSKRMDYNREGVASLMQFSDNYTSQMKNLTGIYFLLKLRDRKPSEHGSKIKLRDIVVYLALAVLTFWVYESRRPPGAFFYQRKGLEAAFMKRSQLFDSSPDAYTTHVPAFNEVTNIDDVWRWLEKTLPDVVWDDTNTSVSVYNLLLGYMSIRVQSVPRPSPRSDLCVGNKGIVEKIADAECNPLFLRGNENTETFSNISRYVGTGLLYSSFRGAEDPSVWRSAEYNAENHDIESIRGSIDTYSASGYSATFRMEIDNNTYGKEVYRYDMAKLKQAGWISPLTRSIIVSFSCYNFAYDMWIASDLLFELPPGGAVHNYHIMRPFNPRSDETSKELTETYVDYVRLVIGLYILIFVGFYERAHKTKYHKAGAWYHVLLTGITDFGIVICIFVVVIWRYIDFGGVFIDPTGVVLQSIAQTESKDKQIGFISLTRKAWAFEQIFCVEGLLMVFISLRLITFFRLRHNVYMLWHTLGKALKAFAFFILMFVPVIIGFVFILHRVFGYYLEEYSLLELSFLQMFNIMTGDMDVSTLMAKDAFMALIFLVLFYFFVTFGLMNVFLTTVVDAYYIVQLTEGGPGEKWTWARLYKWALPALCVQCFQLPGQQGG